MRNLDADGKIVEPTSKNYGKIPDIDTKREQILLIRQWLWLLIPIAGIVGYVEDGKELTDRWGHYPWW